MFVLSLLAMLPFTHRAFNVACTEYYNKLAGSSVTSSVVGGSLMGLGMTISGSVNIEMIFVFSVKERHIYDIFHA